MSALAPSHTDLLVASTTLTVPACCSDVQRSTAAGMACSMQSLRCTAPERKAEARYQAQYQASREQQEPTLCLCLQRGLEAVVHREVHGPVGQQGCQGGREAPVQAPGPLLMPDLCEAACITVRESGVGRDLLVISVRGLQEGIAAGGSCEHADLRACRMHRSCRKVGCRRSKQAPWPAAAVFPLLLSAAAQLEPAAGARTCDAIIVGACGSALDLKTCLEHVQGAHKGGSDCSGNGPRDQAHHLRVVPVLVGEGSGQPAGLVTLHASIGSQRLL